MSSPSTGLLLFLRAQARAQSSSPFLHLSPRKTSSRFHGCRSLSTGTCTPQLLESSVLNLDLLRPQARTNLFRAPDSNTSGFFDFLGVAASTNGQRHDRIPTALSIRDKSSPFSSLSTRHGWGSNDRYAVTRVDDERREEKKAKAQMKARLRDERASLGGVNSPKDNPDPSASAWDSSSGRESLGGSSATSSGYSGDNGDNNDGPNGNSESSFDRYKVGTTEPRLRCTEFDENGNVTLVNGEFRKSELIAKYGLLPRDLRKIDSSLLPHILVRDSAILINLLHLRVLVKHDRVLVFDAYGSQASYFQSAFIYELEHKLRAKENAWGGGALPYEFRALEAILLSVTSGLEAEFEGVREPIAEVLKELEEDIDRDKLRHLLIFSKKLSTFERKARLVRDAIEDVLEEEDDLTGMYLTERAAGKQRVGDDHTEVEMLLESYHKVVDEVVQVSGNLVTNIRNTEEIVKAILDANRNALMLLDLKISIATLGIGSSAFIAGLYGMNVKNFLEEWEYGFPVVTIAAIVWAMIICSAGFRRLRKVQTVSISAVDARVPRGLAVQRASWKDVDMMPPLPGEGRVERAKRLRDARRHYLKGM